MIEIDLKINGRSVFEYQTNQVPRVGEIIDISHDEITGTFTVKKVEHRLFQEKKTKQILSYVIIEAES